MCWSLLILKSSKYCPYHYLTCPPNDSRKDKMLPMTRGWQAFSIKGHMANMLRFEGQSFCHTAQFCHCCVKTDTVGKQMNMVIFQQSFFGKNRQCTRFGPWAIRCTRLWGPWNRECIYFCLERGYTVVVKHMARDHTVWVQILFHHFLAQCAWASCLISQYPHL